VAGSLIACLSVAGVPAGVAMGVEAEQVVFSISKTFIYLPVLLMLLSVMVAL
tara:strand:- start:607 stop:762 length:156 start_codon:yes stop_codon:yes gene_type:complete